MPRPWEGSNFPLPTVVAESLDWHQRQCVLHGVRKNAGKWAPGEDEIRRRVRYIINQIHNKLFGATTQRAFVRAQSA
jgi:hypothetical protein